MVTASLHGDARTGSIKLHWVLYCQAREDDLPIREGHSPETPVRPRSSSLRIILWSIIRRMIALISPLVSVLAHDDPLRLLHSPEKATNKP